MHLLPIGTIDAEYKNGEPLIIEPAARRMHVYILGATGAGKSTLLRNMVANPYKSADESGGSSATARLLLRTKRAW